MSYDITLVDKGFYRSPRPTKEQLAQWKLVYGIGCVINLEGDSPDAVACKKTDCAQLCIDESYMGMSGIKRPAADFVREAVYLIQWNRKKGISTLAHCLHGVDRTGIVCGGYRIIVQDWDVEKAWQEALSFGLHWMAHFWWRKTFEELKGGN